MNQKVSNAQLHKYFLWRQLYNYYYRVWSIYNLLLCNMTIIGISNANYFVSNSLVVLSSIAAVKCP